MPLFPSRDHRERSQVRIMNRVRSLLVRLTCVLLLGVFSMARGGDYDKRNANRFMRWRVIMQGIAILLFVIFMMTWHRG